MGRTSAKRGNDSQRGSLTTSNNIVTSPQLPVQMGPGKSSSLCRPYFPARLTVRFQVTSNTAVQLNPQPQQTVTSKVTRADVGVPRKEQFNEKTSCILLVILTCWATTRAADWRVVASPNGGTQANSLSSVAATTDKDVWAVGWPYNQSLGAYRTLTEHWNGTRWSLVRSPNATSGYNLLNGVAAVAANDIWTVGQAAIGSTYNTLVQHWDGVAWSIVPSPNIAGNSNVLEAISVVSPSNIWAVGFSTDSNFINKTLTLHWDGNTWSIVPSPSLDSDILFAVDALASNDVWAVGRTKPGGYGEDRTLTMHWDGSAWTSCRVLTIVRTTTIYLASRP